MTWGESAQIITSGATLLGSLVTAAVAIRSLIRIEEVHKATNSLTDRLVESTRIEAHAAGVKEGQDAALR